MPPRAQPKAYVLPLKTHKLTVLLTASLNDTIGTIKKDALTALKAPVLNAPNPYPESVMDVDETQDWTVPTVTSVKDFELCRAIKERGRPTGQYVLLEGDMQVRNCLTNWEVLYVQFKDNNGELLPVQVSTPALLDEEDEEAELAAARKGKRKAPPEDE
ncbi:uncharacterized protein B0H18DRAFT_965369 [Fomitopsis serialis]|uniref:uncharacterized protein n=1 Tax=Fomitopsis serialis TaxID=139415 RepID=UPI0020072B03|nr:uncharacterized protein B0H18DRAFT_965369 [Neoantrodia serialis]KAH9938072.1 hypothetical protein B0H18DRAFT_965369 [Neoantrodia serialis]